MKGVKWQCCPPERYSPHLGVEKGDHGEQKVPYSLITRGKSQRLLCLSFFLQHRRVLCLLNSFYLLSLPDSLLQHIACLVPPGIHEMPLSPKQMGSRCSLSLITTSILSQTGMREGHLPGLCGQSGYLGNWVLALSFKEQVLAESLTNPCFPTSLGEEEPRSCSTMRETVVAGNGQHIASLPPASSARTWVT